MESKTVKMVVKDLLSADNQRRRSIYSRLYQVTFILQVEAQVYNYLCRRLVSEGIVTLGVTLCVCPLSRLCHVSTARHIGLGGKGNVLYPVLSNYYVYG